jgi:quercetin dioxygenase-like cupin family protein
MQLAAITEEKVQNVIFAEQFKANEGQFAIDLGTVHHFSSGVYAKQMHLPKGYVAMSHAHNYDHLSILGKGRVIVRTDNDAVEYVAPACITIEAKTHHQIEALEDTVWFCIHAAEETDADKIDEVLICRDC